MPSKSYGNSYAFEDYKIIGESEEIPTGHMSYVVNRSTRDYDNVDLGEWQQFLNGDLTELKNRIENEIAGTTVKFLRVSWTSAIIVDVMPHVPVYRVRGFRVEALVENTSGAGLTGLEIVVIIGAIAFLAVVIAFIALGAWIVYEVITATKEVSPVATIGVGIVLFVVIVFALLVLFGAKVSGSKKGWSFGKG